MDLCWKSNVSAFWGGGYRVLLLMVRDKAGLPKPLPFLRALGMEMCGGWEILSVEHDNIFKEVKD